MSRTLRPPCSRSSPSLCAARADIFQWEYINPADPSQGKQQSTTLAPDGAGVDAVPAPILSHRNLTMAYLIGADLTNATFLEARSPTPISRVPMYDERASQRNSLQSFWAASLLGLESRLPSSNQRPATLPMT